MYSVNDSSMAFQMMGIALVAASLTACQGAPEPKTCHLTFTNGVTLADMPLATTADQQRQGLQGVDDPAPGMVFSWEEPTRPAMWMKDTPAALDAAFIDQGGAIIHTATMHPHSKTRHYAPEPVIAVVEVPGGELEALGIAPGAQVASTSCW